MSILKMANTLSEADEVELQKLHDIHEKKHLLHQNLEQQSKINALENPKFNYGVGIAGGTIGGAVGKLISKPKYGLLGLSGGTALGMSMADQTKKHLNRHKYDIPQDELNRIQAAEMEKDEAELALLEFMDQKGVGWQS